MRVETSSSKPCRTLLIVDADEVLRTCLLRVFRARGYSAHGASSAEQARVLALQHSPDYALLDISVDGSLGLQLAHELSTLASSARIVIFTGPQTALATRTNTSQVHAFPWLMKPADVDQIVAAFESHAATIRHPAAQLPAGLGSTPTQL